MNALKNARVKMLTAVDELFKTNKEAYQHAPALEEDTEELSLILLKLDTALEKAALSTTDLTAAKQDLKGLILVGSKTMIASGNAHASHKKDQRLQNQLTPFIKQLNNAKDAELPLVCANLMTHIKTIPAADLAKRGVHASHIAQLETQVAQFKSNLPKNQSARDETSIHHTQSEALTAEGLAIVNGRMAPTLFHIQDKIPTFYAQFTLASTIRKPASAQTQLKVSAVDNLTNDKLEDVFLLQNGKPFDAQKELKRLGALKKAKVANIPPTVLEIVRAGYTTVQLPMPKLKRGQVNILTVRMTRHPET